MSNDPALFWHLPSVLQPEPRATLTGESANMSPEPQQETNVSVQQPQWRAHPTETLSKIKCFTLQEGEKQLVTSTLCLLPSSATEKETSGEVLFNGVFLIMRVNFARRET